MPCIAVSSRMHRHYECGKDNKSSLYMRAETDLSNQNIHNIRPHIKEHQIINWEYMSGKWQLKGGLGEEANLV